MLEYTMGKTEDKADIIDFINYVFSQADVPHDFKKLMPKLYADHVEGLKASHYLVKKDKKIQAVVADYIIDVSVHGHTQKWGMIGNVSVHPYARKEGYMKELMQRAIEEAVKQNVDILVLSGKRQRYGYFGFENAGAELHFTVNTDNIRHCLSNIDCSKITIRSMEGASVEELQKAKELHERKEIHALRAKEDFLDILHTWNREAFLIYKDHKMIGYVSSRMNEVVLEEEKDFPSVLKYLFEKQKFSEIMLSVAPFEKERAAFLSQISESCFVGKSEMIKVLNWKNVLSAFLELKAKTVSLLDGKIEIVIEKEAYQICVEDGVPSVEAIHEVGEHAVLLKNQEAQQKFFGLDTLLLPDERFKNWFPLPFSIDKADVC